MSWATACPRCETRGCERCGWSGVYYPEAEMLRARTYDLWWTMKREPPFSWLQRLATGWSQWLERRSTGRGQ